MASHIVCPLCGKSSILTGFPAGEAQDLILQTFKGLGRGKGFTVISRTSGLDDSVLCEAVTGKVFTLLAALAAHGHVRSEDLAAIVAAAPESRDEARPAEDLTEKVRVLEQELSLERTTRKFLEAEVTQLQLDRIRTAAHATAANDERNPTAERLDRAREVSSGLIDASRDLLVTLHDLRSHVRESTTSHESLAKHARTTRRIVEAVKEIHSTLSATHRGEAGETHSR